MTDAPTALLDAAMPGPQAGERTRRTRWRAGVRVRLNRDTDRGWIVVARDGIVIRESEPLAARMHGARRPHLVAR